MTQIKRREVGSLVTFHRTSVLVTSPQPPASLCVKWRDTMDDNMKYLADELLNEPHGQCYECGEYVLQDELVSNEALWSGKICDKCASEHSETEYTEVWGDTDPQEEK